MLSRNASKVVTLFVACGICAGCSGTPSKDGVKVEGEKVKLQGAGASFPAPLYIKWFKDYKAAKGNVTIEYQSVGSGAGKKNLIDGTVDFGASDAAMTEEEVKKVDKGVVMLPMTAGTIVLAYNLEGVKDLKLSREAYSGIFLGKITKWNDEAIKKTNPGASLPDKTINVVVRSDGSGTSFVFTKHLSAISPEFAKSPGVNTSPNWPQGNAAAPPTKSKGNEGVTASITTTPGAIGYIEFSFAKKLSVAALENKAGQFVMASTATAQDALNATEMPSDLVAWLPDPAGKDSYPIVTYTWLLCYKKYDSKRKVDALKDVIDYCLTKGQESSEALGYVPLSEKVVAKVKEAAQQITTAEGKASLDSDRRFAFNLAPRLQVVDQARRPHQLSSH